MHRLLARQIRKHLGDSVPREFDAFVASIEATYRQHDEDRALLQRSMELSSDELIEANSALLSKAEEHAQAVCRLQGTVEALGFSPPAFSNAQNPNRDDAVSADAVSADANSLTHSLDSLIGIADLLAEQVSLRNEAERLLRTRETRLRMLMQSASDAIVVMDGQTGMIIDANEAALRLTGYALNELVSLHHTQLNPERVRDDYDAAFRQLVEERLPYSEGEAWLLHRDGHEIPIDVTSTMMVFDGVPLVQGILRDATARRQNEAALIEALNTAEAASRLKSTFLANMSHELRTPLTAIIGFSEVLGEALADSGDRELAAYAELISEGGARLLVTLNSVLEYARLEAGRLPLHPEPFDLCTHLTSTVALFEQEALRKGLTLHVEGDSPCPVALDPHAVERAVINLVSNAIKFTDHGHVRVTLRRVNDRVHIAVADTGIGIAPAFMDRLFAEFEQESIGVSRRHEGSGLGLAITKRLVELLGGTIEVESHPGEGARFVLDLPRNVALQSDVEARVSVTPTAVPLPIAPDIPVRRVLLIDSEPTTGALLAHLLSENYRLSTTLPQSLSDTLAVASETGQWPSVIVFGSNRTDALADLRAALRNADGKPVPHLIFLSDEPPEIAAQSYPDDFDAVLSRPFTRSALYDALRDPSDSAHSLQA